MTEVDVPVPPLSAAQVFGPREDLARAYVGLLADTGISHGLIGPREVPRLWDRHVLNCAVIQELLPPNALCADIGSGAGLPGLALAIARPDITMHLVEPLQRRARWLDVAVAELGLSGVTVHCSRADALHGVLTVDVVTARAVAELATLGQWCLPLLPPGGRLLAIKGSKAEGELAEAWPALQRLGCQGGSVRECGGSIIDPPTRVVEVIAGSAPSSGKGRARPRSARTQQRKARAAAARRHRGGFSPTGADEASPSN